MHFMMMLLMTMLRGGKSDLTDTLGSGDGGGYNIPSPTEADWRAADAAASGDAAPPARTEEEDADIDAGTGGSDDTAPAAKPPAAKPAAEKVPEPPPAADPEDADVDLGNGVTMKRSEILALREGQESKSLAAQRQELADQTKAFEALKSAHEKGIKEILADPAKYAQLRKDAGLDAAQAGPHPVKDANTWAQARYNAYIAKGWKPEQITREMIVQDLTQAQALATSQDLATLQETLASREREIEEQKHFESVTKELETLFGRSEYAHAATPEGRRFVDALLAEAEKSNKEVDLEDVVKEVAGYGAALIAGYTGDKAKDAKSTGRLVPAGGAPKAPDPKDYGNGWDGFGKIAKDRIRSGGR